MLADIQVVDNARELPAMARVIHDYWLSKCGGRRMPRRADIDPIEISPQLLPFVQLVDVVNDDRRYIYRLNGTQDVRVRGHDPRGKSVKDAFWGPDAEDALGCYDRVVAERAPIIDPVPYDNGEFISDFSLFLPLSDDDETVNMIIVFSTNHESKPTFNSTA
jgi:hypothetical protein